MNSTACADADPCQGTSNSTTAQRQGAPERLQQRAPRGAEARLKEVRQRAGRQLEVLLELEERSAQLGAPVRRHKGGPEDLGRHAVEQQLLHRLQQVDLWSHKRFGLDSCRIC